MVPVPPGPDIQVASIRWQEAWRVIASRFPPIHLFERVSSDPAVWDVLIDLEQRTNPRVRDEVGNISLVPPDRRVSGPGASYCMAPFTHVNPRGSRFSDGSFGMYYAADRLGTAIKETVYHFENFARDSSDPPRREDMRVLLGSIVGKFHDVGTLSPEHKMQVLDTASYKAARALGAALKAANSNGIVYPSVRDSGGSCLAAFWPDVIGVPVQERHLQYEWDGSRVSRYFNYRDETWAII